MDGMVLDMWMAMGAVLCAPHNHLIVVGDCGIFEERLEAPDPERAAPQMFLVELSGHDLSVGINERPFPQIEGTFCALWQPLLRVCGRSGLHARSRP